MNKTSKIIGIIVISSGLGACAGMTSEEKGTLIGAGVGAAVGSAVTGGHPVGIVGGAAVGGVIGNEIGEDRDRRYR
jgi:osmotically inducible lipoprotein OsmB